MNNRAESKYHHSIEGEIKNFILNRGIDGISELLPQTLALPTAVEIDALGSA